MKGSPVFLYRSVYEMLRASNLDPLNIVGSAFVGRGSVIDCSRNTGSIRVGILTISMIGMLSAITEVSVDVDYVYKLQNLGMGWQSA